VSEDKSSLPSTKMQVGPISFIRIGIRTIGIQVMVMIYFNTKAERSVVSLKPKNVFLKDVSTICINIDRIGLNGGSGKCNKYN